MRGDSTTPAYPDIRALVTGASGFLGGRLTQMLLDRGAQVTVLARPTSDLRHLPAASVRVATGSLEDAASLAEAVQDATHIFHCAACSTDWAPLERYIAANVTGTRNLLAAAAASPSLERFVHVSTTDVYGYPVKPCAEDGALVETRLPYNRTKLAGEQAVRTAIQQGLPATIVRPGTIYGPRGTDFIVDIAGLLHQRLMAVIDHGQAPGGFIYVDDCAEAMIAAALSPATPGQAYNLIDGAGGTWHDYLALFAQQLGVKPPWIDLSFKAAMTLARYLEAPHRLLRLPGKPLLTQHAVYLLGRDQNFPITKAEQDFGWVPQVGLEEGLQRSVAWLTEQRTKPSS